MMDQTTMDSNPAQRVGRAPATSALIAVAAGVVVLLTDWPFDGFLNMAFLAAWMGGAWAALSASATRVQELLAGGLVAALALVALTWGAPWSGRSLWMTFLVIAVLMAKALVRRARH